MLSEESHYSCAQMRTLRLVDQQGFAQSLHAEACGLAPKFILIPLPSQPEHILKYLLQALFSLSKHFYF